MWFAGGGLLLKRVIEMQRLGRVIGNDVELEAISDLLVALSFSHISARPQHLVASRTASPAVSRDAISKKLVALLDDAFELAHLAQSIFGSIRLDQPEFAEIVGAFGS